MKLNKLSEADLSYCKVIAGIRRMCNRARHTGNYMNLGADCNNNNEELGVIAEYAFCKQFNIHFDATFAGKDAGYDCVLNNNRIDIKAIADRSLNLVAYIKEENAKIDKYVLIYVGECGETEIIGWCNRDDLVSEKNIRDLGHGNRYFLSQNMLNKWQSRKKAA